MPLEDQVDLAVFIGSIVSIGVGVSCAVSVPWALVAVGGVLVVAVLVERFTLRLIAGKKQPEAQDESA